jgi:hypothetical protein
MITVAAALVLAALVLTAAARLRGAEYDEQYTLFLTGGAARPAWPATAFDAATIPAIQAGHASLSEIATDLRRTDVHPPLYFLAVSEWRATIGAGLFRTRLFSVLCGLISLATVGAIARRCAIAVAPAMLLTLGSYAFAYTNVIARGFAPALTLTLGGVLLLCGRQTPRALLVAGALFGAASACNYLAVFVAIAVGVLAGGWLLLPTALPFLALDAWFFAAQHGTRTGQFPPFSLLSALPRLAGFQVASLFGGLPLYAEGIARIAIGACIAALALVAFAAVLAARPWRADPRIRLLAAAAIAPPLGLLCLGVVFNNTPIELRYLCFSVPFVALLIAWACGRGRGWARALPIFIGIMQCIGIVTLAIGPATMQPSQAAARAAARGAGDATARGADDAAAHVAGDAAARAANSAASDVPSDTVALVPFGNDGVGIVGAFGNEAPASLALLIVRATDAAATLADRVAGYRRVILVLLSQDRDSAATLPIMREAFTRPGWRRSTAGSNIEVYERE